MVFLTNEKGHKCYVGDHLVKNDLQVTNPQEFPGHVEEPLQAAKMNFGGQGDPAMNEDGNDDDEVLAVKEMQF